MTDEPTGDATADGRARGDPLVRPVVILHAFGLWLVMAALAVANGILRETALIPAVGERTGQLVSTAALVAAIAAVVAVYVDRTSVRHTRGELLGLGIVWVCLTVPFEFVVGYVDGIPPEETLAQYDVTAGEVWIAVPLTLLVAPLLFGSLLRNGRTNDRTE